MIRILNLNVFIIYLRCLLTKIKISHKLINMYSNKNIAIAGFALEGHALYDYLTKHNEDIKIHIFDEKYQDVPHNCIFHHNLNIPKSISTVYKAPGIPLDKLILENKNTQIKTITNILFENIKGLIIGITGTKGKSTTSSLIYHVLKDFGLDVVLIGNIGDPGLEYLDSDHKDKVYVYEMSSYMCDSLTSYSPHIAVITNIYKDHLDYHKTFENYVNAKLKINKFQKKSDYLITTNSTLETFHKLNLDINNNVLKKIIDVQNLNIYETKLLGSHNQININLTYEVAKLFSVSQNQFVNSIKTFDPLPGRLEKIDERKGVIFYEDYLATIPEATWAGIQALGDVNTIILGGQDRGIDFEEFAKQLETSSIQNFILFADTGIKMVKYIKDKNKNIINVSNMEEAINAVYKYTKGICLLSTASPSLNMFKNYKDRSEQFKYWINKLSI